MKRRVEKLNPKIRGDLLIILEDIWEDESNTEIIRNLSVLIKLFLEEDFKINTHHNEEKIIYYYNSLIYIYNILS